MQHVVEIDVRGERRRQKSRTVMAAAFDSHHFRTRQTLQLRCLEAAFAMVP